MPARFSALTRSVRPVNLRNGRKFDTTQNSDDLAHRSSRDSKNARTLAPSAPSSTAIPRRFQEHQVATRHPSIGLAGGRCQTAPAHLGLPRGIQRNEVAALGPWTSATAATNRQVHPAGLHIRVEHRDQTPVIEPPLRAEPTGVDP